MRRREFIESIGATCRNWTWSWAFVNHEKRTVIFGAWDRETAGGTTIILDERWQISRKGRRQPGYPEALEYIRLVEREGYVLNTFPMIYSARLIDEVSLGPSSIAKIIPKLSACALSKVGTKWYASSSPQEFRSPDEIYEGTTYFEGATKRVAVNAYERNTKARLVCISHYGCQCYVCGLDMQEKYGNIAIGLIHVHHTVPIAHLKIEYEVDPIRDLRPVCPSCHAVIHRADPPLDVDELKAVLSLRKDA